jgi:hypothetical protein
MLVWLQGVDRSGFVTRSGTAPPAAWDFAILLISLVLLILGFFLLNESVKTTKYCFPDEPNPESGMPLASIVAVFVLLFWFAFTVRRGIFSGEMAPGEQLSERLFDLIFWYPQELAPGLLLASFLPIGIALFKLLTIVTARPRELSKEDGYAGPLGVAMQVVFNLLTGAASVIRLISTFK